MSKFLITFLMVCLLSSFAFATSTNDKVDWDAFSANLNRALKSENMGVKLSAMQLVIKYSDKIDVSNSVFDVMREFRDNEELAIRQLSLVTLYKMNNEWAIDFLKRLHKFEENTKIKNTIKAIVFAYDNDEQDKIATIMNDTYLSVAY